MTSNGSLINASVPQAQLLFSLYILLQNLLWTWTDVVIDMRYDTFCTIHLFFSSPSRCPLLIYAHVVSNILNAICKLKVFFI